LFCGCARHTEVAGYAGNMWRQRNVSPVVLSNVLAAEIPITTPVGAAGRRVVDSQVCIGGPVRDMVVLSGRCGDCRNGATRRPPPCSRARRPEYFSRCRCRRSSVCGTAMNGRYRGLLRPAHGCRRRHAMPGGSHLARLIRAR